MRKTIPALFFLLSICRPAIAQTGVPDATFGSGTPSGTVVFSGINAGSFDQGVALQSDGRILVTTGENSGMTRLNTNGSADNSFGGGWVATGQFSFGDLIIQGDGKILAAGKPNAISFGDLYIWRLKSDGSFDSTFGKNGRVGDSSLGSGYEHIALQSGNKIIWSGALGLKRLFLTDGSLDVGFGAGGFVRSTQLPIFPAAMVIDNSNGNILLGGYTKVISHVALVRLLPGGIVDPTFGSNGVDSLNLKATGLGPVMELAINSAGKIIMVSDYDNGSSNGVVCVGFNANGSVDNTFGTSSMTYPDWNITGGYAYAGGMAIANDDKIFIAATIMDNGASANGNDIAIRRLTSTGNPDGTYGGPKLDINHSSDRVQAIAIQPDGKLLINGSSAGKELVARYTISGTGVKGTSNEPLQVFLTPNPVQSGATMSITATESTTISAAIYTMDGRQVATICKEVKIPAGTFKKSIGTNALPAGVYHMIVRAGGRTEQVVFQQL